MKTRNILLLSIVALCYSVSAEVMIEQANISGTLITRPMKKQAPLYERGVKKVAVIGFLESKVGRSHVGVTIFKNKFTEIDTPSNLDISLITSVLENSETVADELSFHDESQFFETLESNMKISGWDGKGTILDSAESESLISELQGKGYDSILYITDGTTYDFIGKTNQYLPPRGLYTRPKTEAIYAAFSIRLFDLKTKKEVKHSSYTQGTAVKCSDIDFKSDPEISDPKNLAAVEEKLNEAYTVATLQVIKMLKANK